MIDNRSSFFLALIAVFSVFALQLPDGTGQQTGETPQRYDVVVYGGSSGGVTAAVQAARMDRSVLLVSPREHIGGLSSSGLGRTDTQFKDAVGGLSREFYRRVKKRYDQESNWKYEAPEDYSRYQKDSDALWRFEPHVAENVFDTMVREAGLTVLRGERLNRSDGVRTENGWIQSIETRSGKTIRGRTFIDATYVGDLMAAAGVSYTVGRESNSKYNENYNGVQKDRRDHHHFFFEKVSPYREPGDPTSGLVPRVHNNDPGQNGEGDRRVQAYCFRLCMTKVDENKVEWPKPDGYDPEQYELLFRAFEQEAFAEPNDLNKVLLIKMMPNRKTDTNNNGPFSTDNIGKNHTFPEASYEKRREIYREHERYQKGLLWTLANHPRVPEKVRKQAQQWGLAADEFQDNGNWPYMLYIREGRRMIGSYVMTEQDVLKRRATPNSVGLGSYTMDSHNVQRYVTEDGHVQNEGDVGIGLKGPYQIAYGSIVPRKEEIRNLLVPVSMSASHIAFGSIRMEPTFMILGQSAGTAAVHAIKEEVPVQDVDYDRLNTRLRSDGQRLYPGVPPLNLSNVKGRVLDDKTARFTGSWPNSTSIGPFVKGGYRHDENTKKGDKQALFETELSPGTYEVRLGYTPHSNRATNVPVTVHTGNGTETVRVNQKKTPEHHEVFSSLGTFRISGAVQVRVGTEDTDGYVVVDSVQFVKKE